VITPQPIAEYFSTLRRLPHAELEAIAAEGRAESLPIVDSQTGALLHVLTRCSAARRVLEIGTAIGYSGLWIATGLPADGMLITLERNAERAARARAHFEAAGMGARVSVMIGEADRHLHKVAGAFDLIFQDGDKHQYEPMLDRLVNLLRPGGVLVTDNALWSGEVVEGYVESPQRDEAETRAIRDYNRRLVADPRLYTTIVAVGDGVAISVRA
jgi:predicted O-methyltransferase YrrM